MSELAHTNHTEKKDFLVRSSSLKDVRSFCREVFEKLHIDQSLKDELVLAIAEAAQNIVKHAYKNAPDTQDKISNIIKESLKNTNLDDQLAENSLSVPLKEAREKFEKEYLSIQLKKFNGNISKTANFVGMERSALHRKLKGLGIKEFN